MRIIFFGSDDFAALHLDALVRSGHEVLAIVTQPDKPKGRGMKIVYSEVKGIGLKNKIKLFQPRDIKDKKFVEEIRSFSADMFVVIAYGKFLPDELLAIPKLCPINVHGSLLPRLRGAAPINWAVINGEKQTGITVAKINAQMDSGDILSNKKIDIAEEDTSVTLRKKMMEVGPELLLETIDALAKGECIYTKQNEEQVTFAPKLTKELGNIDWSKPAIEINNLVRGLLPWPTAYTFLKGKQLKILKAEVVDGNKDHGFGEIVDVKKDGFVIQSGKEALLVKEVHLESSKQMSVESFLVGHKIEQGLRFPNL